MSRRGIRVDGRALLVLVFGVKAVVLAQLGDHPLLQPQGELDATYYVELARRVADGGPFAVREPFFVSPLYVYFLAMVFRLGGSLFAARLVQVLLGTLAVALIFRTTEHLFGRRSAWIAAALATATGLFTFYEVLILQAALDPALTAAALYLVARTQADGVRWQPVAAGIALGLLTLNRPNALPYAAVAAVLIAATGWRAPRVCRVQALRAAALVAGVLLVLLPNALRNYAVSGEPILISSHGGLNFYIGNNPSASGTYQRLPGVTPSIVGQVRDSTELAQRDIGRSLSPAEVSDYFYRRGWEWIRGAPGSALALFARKLAIVFHSTNVPLNYSYAYYSRDENTLLRVLAIGPWILVPFGLVGLLLPSAGLRARGYWVWASFVPVYALSVAMFFVSSRYRMPILVPLCCSCAAALVWVWDRMRARDVRALALPMVGIVTLGILVRWDLRLDDGRGSERTRRAVWLVEQGRTDEALAYVRKISADHSHPGVLRFRVGDALASAGRFDEGITLFTEALAIDRGQPAIHLALGQALVVRGRATEAVPHLQAAFDAGHQREVAATWLARAFAIAGENERAVAFLRDLPIELGSARRDTAYDLGTIALDVGSPQEAIRWLEKAVGQAPEHADSLAKLGTAWLLAGQPHRAAAPLEQACRLAPTDATMRLNLAVTYAQLGRIAEARSAAEEALRLDPSEPRTRDLLDALRR